MLHEKSYRAVHSVVLPAARAFFQRALARAESLARPAALNLRLGFSAGLADRVLPFMAAHLALAPARMFAIAARLNFRLLGGVAPFACEGDPRSLCRSF